VACPHGDGESSDCWRLDPPVGEGWQRWETTTEGSPSSPVVATAVELASWAAEAATSFGDVHLSRAHWLRPAHRTRRAAWVREWWRGHTVSCLAGRGRAAGAISIPPAPWAPP